MGEAVVGQVEQTSGDRHRVLRRISYALTAIGLVALAATGLTGWWLHGEVAGWLLAVHMLASPVFTAGLVGMAVSFAERCAVGARGSATSPERIVASASRGQRAVFWAVLALGLANTASIAAAMTPAFGYDGIRTLYAIHRISGMGLVGVAGIHIAMLAVPRRGR